MITTEKELGTEYTEDILGDGEWEMRVRVLDAGRGLKKFEVTKSYMGQDAEAGLTIDEDSFATLINLMSAIDKVEVPHPLDRAILPETE